MNPLPNKELTTKFETIYKLLSLLHDYKPIYEGATEKQRLEHYRDVIQEDIAYIVADLIKTRLRSNE
jgi:hypothetical protein